MSTRVEYDPDLFVVERAASASAELGEFVLGLSMLGAGTTTEWVTVPLATFSFSEEYTPNADGVLIYGRQTATVSMSYWHKPTTPPLYSGDRIRVRYDDKTLFLGTVDTARYAYRVDSESRKYGA